MKICIAFYKAEGNLLNKFVRQWTNSKYSHAELILNDGETWISITPFLNSKIYSKTKPEFEEKDWDFLDVAVTSEQHKTIEDFYELTEGCAYDWVGMLLSQFVPFHIKRKGKWYCSEWIAYALRISGVIDWKIIQIYDKSDLSPAVLHKMVQRIKHVETSEV